MTLSSDIFRKEPVLLARRWHKEPGQFTISAENGAKYCRASLLGCGGQGDAWGGGGAFARTVFQIITNAEALLIQVGNVSTATVAGDSWVKRLDGTVIAYADRGRGNGQAGLASRSAGNILIDGNPGSSPQSRGGKPATDSAIYAPIFTDGMGYNNLPNYFGPLQADYGGGGFATYAFESNGEVAAIVARSAGSGVVVMEYFNQDPGY